MVWASQGTRSTRGRLCISCRQRRAGLWRRFSRVLRRPPPGWPSEPFFALYTRLAEGGGGLLLPLGPSSVRTSLRRTPRRVATARADTARRDLGRHPEGAPPRDVGLPVPHLARAAGARGGPRAHGLRARAGAHPH